MKHILYCLGLLALTLPASASLWVPDTANYVGDFTGVGAFGSDSNGSSQNGDINVADLDQGWISFENSGGLAWAPNSGVAERDGGDGSRPNGLGILFTDPGFTGAATLSLDYNFGNNGTNGDPGFYLWGIDTATFGGQALRDPGSVAPGGPTPPAGATNLFSLFLDDSSNTSGDVSGFSTAVNLDSSAYDAYLFTFHGEPGNDTFLDNVALAPIPEPSTALALFGLLGLAGMIRRRRALPTAES